MKDQKKDEEIAGNLVQRILPILETGLDPALAREKRKRICEENAISERTLRRYLPEYRIQGFTGLKPKSKGKSESKAINPELMEQAILLRRVVYFIRTGFYDLLPIATQIAMELDYSREEMVEAVCKVYDKFYRYLPTRNRIAWFGLVFKEKPGEIFLD